MSIEVGAEGHLPRRLVAAVDDDRLVDALNLEQGGLDLFPQGRDHPQGAAAPGGDLNEEVLAGGIGGGATLGTGQVTTVRESLPEVLRLMGEIARSPSFWSTPNGAPVAQQRTKCSTSA